MTASPTIFCINLDRSPDRMEFMRGQFLRLGLTVVERVPGIDGAANVPAWMAHEFEDTPLTSGEIGCYASHLVCAWRIIAQDLSCAVVLEDDVTLQSDFIETAGAAVAAAPPGWDYIHLSSHIKRSVVHVADLTTGRTLIRHTRLPVNTAAYILSNAGARKWLKPRPRIRPNDMDVRYGWLDDLDIYGVYPSPASQEDDFESDIGGTHGGKRKIKDPRNFAPGLASRIYGALWQARKVGATRLARGRVANITNSLRRKATGQRTVAVLR